VKQQKRRSSGPCSGVIWIALPVSEAEFADALTSVMSSGGRSFSSLLKQIEPDKHRETVTDDWDIETFAIVSWVSICWCDRMKANAPLVDAVQFQPVDLVRTSDIPRKKKPPPSWAEQFKNEQSEIRRCDWDVVPSGPIQIAPPSLPEDWCRFEWVQSVMLTTVSLVTLWRIPLQFASSSGEAEAAKPAKREMNIRRNCRTSGALAGDSPCKNKHFIDIDMTHQMAS
jgi:hypothetical protein